MREHEVHVFANTYETAGADGVHFHRIPAARSNAFSTILSFMLPATRALGRGWDIIHAQGLTCLRFNVITAHICNAAWADAQRASDGVARTWRQRTFERVITPLEGAAYRLSPGAEAIAISHKLKGELARYYKRTERVTVIHHGVDTVTFSPETRDALRLTVRRELGIDDDRFLAVFVGDLRKGATNALETIARVPDANLALLSRSDITPYVAHATHLGISDRAIFCPASEQVERFYAAADAFLFPSPYDAFGMVVSEAMAMGLPVITSRQAGASELITHGVSGFIHDAGDTTAMAHALGRLSADPGLRHRIGMAGHAAVAGHTWDSVAAQTLAIYHRARPLT